MRIASLLLAVGLLTSCTKTSTSSSSLSVAATPMPHAEILSWIEGDLREQGIQLVVFPTEDYNLPNRALADHEVDANFFQHIPFLEDQLERFHYPLLPLTAVHIEPLGVYSDKFHNIEELPHGASVAVPSDPTNEARALQLLAALGLLTFHPTADPFQLQPRDIADNPKSLRIFEVDAPFLSRSLPDVAAAVIPTNFALEANLSPLHDALSVEGNSSPYVNIVAIRDGEIDRPELQALKKAITSEEIRKRILEHYHGAILPAF